jgi:hypothetical protein
MGKTEGNIKLGQWHVKCNIMWKLWQTEPTSNHILLLQHWLPIYTAKCLLSTPRFLSIATSTTISIWKIFFLHKIAFPALLRAGEHSYCGISILLLLYDEMTKEELHNSNLNQYGRDCWCEIDFIWMYDDDWVIKQYWGCVSLRRVVEHEKQ